MEKRLTIAAIIAAILCFGIAQSEFDEVEDKIRRDLEQSLSSVKITVELKSKFLDSHKSPVDERVDIIIEFEGANFLPIRKFKEDLKSGKIKATATRGERISNLVERLEENTALSQKDVIRFLEAQQSNFRSLWVANEIYVREADAQLVGRIAERFGTVAKIRPVGFLKIIPPVPPKPPSKPDLSLLEANGAPWNINQMKARCKDIDCLGEGVVVAVIDGGVRHTHVEIRDNYRPDYNWFDAIYSTESANFNGSDDLYGTHVLGIAVGKTKGVAPEAQWIACKGFDLDGVSHEGYLKACGEFALCPTLPDGTNRDCSKAPHIVSNSWNAQPDELLTFPGDFYYGTVAAWNAAGILSTFIAGWDGPYCSSVSPPGSYDIAFAVGNVDNSSNIDLYSPRGPVLNSALMGFKSEYGISDGVCERHCISGDFGEGGRLICTLNKPDIVAPGVNINSSTVESDTSYGVDSGTGNSAPAVAGVLALVLCANNETPGNPATLDVATAYNILRSTADTSRINLEEGNGITTPVNFQRQSNLLCNIGFGDKCGTFPNNVYGSGEIDACAAFKYVKGGLGSGGTTPGWSG